MIDAIVAALEAQSIQLEQYYAELGHGQQELSIVHLPVVEAADTQILVRETIRAVASSYGLVASLAPKPWPGQAGNGAHVHFSVWDPAGERNLLHDAGRRYALSETAERFAAGILPHTPALLALTAPSFNSFRRLLPQHWSSAFVCWDPTTGRQRSAFRPRSGAWRSPRRTSSTSRPTRAATHTSRSRASSPPVSTDSSAVLELPEPMLVDPATLTDAERERVGATRYPETLGAALDALERDELLTGAMGGALTASYVAVRRSEFEAYGSMEESAQYRGHFEKC